MRGINTFDLAKSRRLGEMRGTSTFDLTRNSLRWLVILTRPPALRQTSPEPLSFFFFGYLKILSCKIISKNYI
jgi:hypothetical protein